MQRRAAIALIVGSLLFLVAAFMPISMKVFPERDAQKRIEYFQEDQAGWLISSVLFGVGSVVAVGGLALFALHLLTFSKTNTVRWASYLDTALAALGALLWLTVVYTRIALPVEALSGSPPGFVWAFPVYTILTQMALIILGFVLLQMSYSSWLGWGTILLAGLSLVAFLVLKDMPPFTHYLITLVIGMMLLREAPAIPALG